MDIRKFLLFIFGILYILPAFALVLVDNGQSKYSIVVADDAVASEKHAAAELRKYIKLITGAKLSISSEAKSEYSLFVGQSAGLNIDFSGLKKDEIIFKSKNNNIYLSGDRPRGSLYAVYDFLEKYLGVKFYTPDEVSIPQKSTINIPELDYRYAPFFANRGILLKGITRDMIAKYRVNGHFNRATKENGGNNKLLGWTHTFHRLISEKKYMQTKPEWFSLRNGRRVGAQLCLSNDEMRAELTKNALAWLKHNPDTSIISISQNDNSTCCTCANCKAVDKEEGGPSGSLIRFVNKVAEDIEKEYPNVLISTLAYTYTRAVPKKVHPRKNVLIRLCFIEADCNRPINSVQNKKLYQELKNWSKVAPQIGVWYYAANFKNFYIPHPNWHIIAQDLQLFAKNKVTSVFIEGEHGMYSGNGDLGYLRMWLYSKLLWNPYLNQDKLIVEFLTAFYKDAAGDIARYMQLMEAEVKRPKARLNCYMVTTSSWLTLNTLLKAKDILNSAISKVVNQPKIKKRVEQQMMNVNNAILLRGEYSIFNKNRRKSPKIDLQKVYDDFEIVYTSLDWNKKYRKTGQTYLNQIRKNIFGVKKSPMIPKFCKGLDDNDWFELQIIGTIKDPEASNGKTLKYDQINRWGFQRDLPSNPSEDNFFWNVKIAIKIPDVNLDSNADALCVGYYNTVTKVTRSYTFKVKKFSDGKYQWLDLGKVNLNEAHYIWVMNRPGIVSYIDRVIMTRENINLSNSRDYVPEICKNIPRSKWKIFPASQNLFERFLGTAADFIKDENSSNGTVVRLFNNASPWAVQIRNITPGKYDIYIKVRCKSEKPSGRCLQAGKYKSRAALISAAKASGSTFKYFLVRKNLKIIGKDYIYCAAIKNPTVKYTDVDCIVLILK